MRTRQSFHIAEIIALLLIGAYLFGYICLGLIFITELQFISTIGLLVPPVLAIVAVILLWRRDKQHQQTVWAEIITVLFLLAAGFFLNMGLILPDPAFNLEPSMQMGWGIPLVICISPGFILLLAAVVTYWIGVLRPEMAAYDAPPSPVVADIDMPGKKTAGFTSANPSQLKPDKDDDEKDTFDYTDFP